MKDYRPNIDNLKGIVENLYHAFSGDKPDDKMKERLLEIRVLKVLFFALTKSYKFQLIFQREILLPSKKDNKIP